MERGPPGMTTDSIRMMALACWGCACTGSGLDDGSAGVDWTANPNAR